MDAWAECLLEADLEYLHQLSRQIGDLVADNAAKTRIIQADDVLIISAEFTDSKNKTRLPVADDFVDRVKAKSQCNPNILGFKHIQTGNYISAQAFGDSPDQRGYAPIYEYFCKGHDKHTTIGYSSNEVTIKISRLSHFTESRYHALIDSLIALAIDGLVEHRARKPVTQKRLYNSMRQIVLRRFKIKAYEWGLLFNPTISAALFPYLAKIAERTEQGTHYLYESPRSDCKIKIYNVTAADDRPNQPPSFAHGDRLKFEITYKAEFYDRKGLQANCLTSQNDIARLLLDHNKKRLETHLINKLPPTALVALWRAAGVSSRSEFMTMIDDDRTTQVSTDERINELKTRMDALESLTNAIKAKQEQQDAINANFQTQLDEIKATVSVQTALPDKRKTRNPAEFKTTH